MPRATDATDTWRATCNRHVAGHVAHADVQRRQLVLAQQALRHGMFHVLCCVRAVLHYGAGPLGLAAASALSIALISSARGSLRWNATSSLQHRANQRCNVCIGSAKGDHAVALPCVQANGVGAGAVQWRWWGVRGLGF